MEKIKFLLAFVFLGTMLAMVPAECSAVSIVQKEILPFAQFTKQSWIAKCYYALNNENEPAENWMDVDFDDVAWGDIEGPISTSSTHLSYYATKWEKLYSSYWVRRHFTVNDLSSVGNVVYYTYNDDISEAYLNGFLIYKNEKVLDKQDSFTLTEEMLAHLVKGDNVLAVKVSDTRGGQAYMDFGLISYAHVNVDVVEPGTLGNLILNQVENFTDVGSLVVSGTLNDADINIIKTYLTNLRIIDMNGLDMTEMPSKFFNQRLLIEKVVLPHNLVSIGDRAFYGCVALQEIDFPTTLKKIGGNCFQNCVSLSQIILPDGLTYLGDWAYDGCVNNTYLKLPPSLTTINKNAFSYNKSLKEIVFAEGLTYIKDNAFVGCSSVVDIKFPNSLHYIGLDAFRENAALENIEFNEGLYQIDDNAFYDCDSLKDVTLPSSLVLAYKSPFDYCDNLKKVTCLSIDPPYMTDQIPYGLSMVGRELYVPALSVNTYKQTDGWSKFPVIKPVDDLPKNIVAHSDLRLVLPEPMPKDWKPSVSLVHDKKGANYFQYGSMAVSGAGTLSVNRFSMVWDPNIQYLYGSRTQNFCSLLNNSHLRADSITVELYIRNNKWTFITFPFDVKVSEIKTNGEGATNWVIRKYNGAKRAVGETGATWNRLIGEDMLEAGKGYIIQGSRYVGTSSQDYSGLVINAVNDANKNKFFIADDVVVPLTEYQSEFAHNRSWNLIGNPYPCYYDTRFMDFTAPITVWNISNSTYEAYSPVDDSYILCPGEAFFVQRPVDNGNIVFDKEGRQINRTARNLESAKMAPTVSADTRSVFNLTITDGIQIDRTRIVINQRASMEYEMEKDACKFMSSDENAPQIFTVNNGIDYAINERPMSDGKASLSVRVNNADVLYTIALDNYKDNTNCQLVLVDNLLGRRTVLTDGQDYTFSVNMNQVHTNRFTLVWENNVTGIDSVDSDSSGTIANIYTLDGKKTTKTNRKGVYVQKGKKVIRK